MLSLCLGNWWLVCFSTALSFRIFCHCLFVFTTLICLSSFDLTAHFLSLFVLTDAVEVAQTVWVVFALSGWQLPSWSVFAQLAVFFLGTSGSMELLFITRWDLNPSLSNQLNCNKDPSNVKYINECPIHRVLRSKMNAFYFSRAFSSWLSLTLSERSLQMDQAMTITETMNSK